MAGSFSDYLENKVLDHLFGGASYSQLGDVYVALSTTTPVDAGTNFTEPSGGSYARAQIQNESGDAEWAAAASGSKANAVAVAFPQATGDWGTITHFGIYDASSDGNLLVWGELTTPATVTTSDTLTFAIGDLVITLD